ncbi:MAG: response regulator transcription factor [Oscillospiraceae bacterium]
MRLLIIEDDKELCAAICAGLGTVGFSTDCCNNGVDGLEYLCSRIYDACLLDRMLPGLDGLMLLKKARGQGVATPVLMLTALGRIGDRVDGLEAGADDYLTKPFDMRELTARIRALVRRPVGMEQKEGIKCGNTVLRQGELLLSGPLGEVSLSKTECGLLEVLFRNFGKLQNREILLLRVWGQDTEVDDGSLDSYIYFVRRRLEAVGADICVATVRGCGYRMEDKT